MCLFKRKKLRKPSPTEPPDILKKVHYKLKNVSGTELAAIKKWVTLEAAGKRMCVHGMVCNTCRSIFSGISKCPCDSYNYQQVKAVAEKIIEYNER